MESKVKNNLGYRLALWLIIVISMIIAVLFCFMKQGFHYDENYSYYSTNVTYGLWPTDHEWKSTEEIKSEYMVLDGESLSLGRVKIYQGYDVHPPLYYYVLRIVCFFSKGVFSKWQGLAINLIFYFICLLLLYRITDIVSGHDIYVNLFTMALFGLSPGYLSTVTFIRMYVMLTMFCFILLLIALRCVRDDTWNFKRAYIPTVIVTCLGFLTHYYFMVFAFFVAAYVCIYLVIRSKTRKAAFIYGGSVCLGMAMAVLYYPVCLSHIFSGYRGTESTQAFMDMSNTVDRFEFFVGMLNDYTFSGMFYILILVGLLLYMFYSYRRKVRWAGRMTGEAGVSEDEKKPVEIREDPKHQKAVLGLMITVTIGFFLIVCKTAMTPSNPAEALRYECPDYGLIIMLIVLGIVRVFEKVMNKKMIAVAVLVISVGCQVYGLCDDRVFFIYEGAQDFVAFAREHKDADIVYIYNPNNDWMIWNDGPELMEYKDIYFVPYDTSTAIDDERLLNSSDIYVYACRSDETDAIIQSIVDENEKLQGYEKISERTFVDVYRLR
ncbi:MAG: hypothetical protein IKN47_04540 [Lachnospiraceae bacterium]|nr:hypothetical protein [Lachnospiraceae bacterium]